jgi:hypothetical protein
MMKRINTKFIVSLIVTGNFKGYRHLSPTVNSTNNESVRNMVRISDGLAIMEKTRRSVEDRFTTGAGCEVTITNAAGV